MVSFDQHGMGRYGPIESIILALRSDLGSDFPPCSLNLKVEWGSLTVNLQRIDNITLSADQVIFLIFSLQFFILSLMDHATMPLPRDNFTLRGNSKPPLTFNCSRKIKIWRGLYMTCTVV